MSTAHNLCGENHEDSSVYPRRRPPVRCCLHLYDIHAAGSDGHEKVVSKGTLALESSALEIDGLWALAVGPDHPIYFTAGQNDGTNGLFGRLAH